MKVILTDKTKKELVELWVSVFGDERDYAKLIFPDGKDICECFAHFDNDTVCSALYLLDCSIKLEDRCYKGKYLYAAATDESYRGKGIMASLIKGAQVYCRDAGLDFIALVPADEGLYGYYEKFDFITAMHRRTEFIQNDIGTEYAVEIGAEEFFSERNNRLRNYLYFTGDSVRYIADCLEYSGYRYYKRSDGGLFITEPGSCLYDEYISDSDAVRRISDNGISAYRVDDDKYGMIYPINSDLLRNWIFTDIYMNIALD